MAGIDDFFERYIAKKQLIASQSINVHRYENADYTCGKVYYLNEIDTNHFLPAKYLKVTMSMSLGRQAVLANTASLDRYYRDFNDLPF
jgi:hypothetical protein